ncbi:hypothetical protein B0T10DRAFT_586782 [Thelonectria olida]|uniref:Secreted protein n=1 Tax=Thelonectria olida TaxID=1576542 RepID=A0A9P9ATM2_9HYPO|nr:hypothetical protein B0T10DRAFT_586782 [Thelonectria olida]
MAYMSWCNGMNLWSLVMPCVAGLASPHVRHHATVLMWKREEKNKSDQPGRSRPSQLDGGYGASPLLDSIQVTAAVPRLSTKSLVFGECLSNLHYKVQCPAKGMQMQLCRQVTAPALGRLNHWKPCR